MVYTMLKLYRLKEKYLRSTTDDFIKYANRFTFMLSYAVLQPQSSFSKQN